MPHLKCFFQECLSSTIILPNKSGVVFNKKNFPISGLTQAFASPAEKGITPFILKKNDIVYSYFKFTQKEDIRADELALLSCKYNIDLKIYAFGRIEQFERDVETNSSGDILLNHTLFFVNYYWESVDPSLDN